MRKIQALALVTLAGLALTGCASGDSSDADSSADAEEFGTVAQLRDAFVEAGGTCDELQMGTQEDFEMLAEGVGLDPSSVQLAACVDASGEIASSLVVAGSVEEQEELVDAFHEQATQDRGMLSSQFPGAVVVGGNWMIALAQEGGARAIATDMGGQVEQPRM